VSSKTNTSVTTNKLLAFIFPPIHRLNRLD